MDVLHPALGAQLEKSAQLGEESRLAVLLLVERFGLGVPLLERRDRGVKRANLPDTADVVDFGAEFRELQRERVK